jgi:predicted alpha/beta superfamily hydrolase
MRLPFSDGTGALDRYENFPSAHVSARPIDVWYPSLYEQRPDYRFPVVYMQDGQNLFDPPITFSGVDWGMDEAVERLIDEGYVPGMIVVGIWNTPQRELEYMPLKPLFKPGFRAFLKRSTLRELPISDAYLKFIVDEVKPFIDSNYRTLPDQAHTFVMGSSMGGLISAYALSEYPHIFGGAGCFSTHLMAAGSILVDYFGEALPKAGAHKLYFDYGTVGLDAPYEYYQKKLDQHLIQLGYRFGEDWITQKFVGGDHSERSWRTRVHLPLKLFLSQGKLAGNPG